MSKGTGWLDDFQPSDLLKKAGEIDQDFANEYQHFLSNGGTLKCMLGALFLVRAGEIISQAVPTI